ncbi:MAG: PAS domain S-box protein [Caldiserica bacterium]|nr:PAS domain S-box protein [Caldisericota bacterium]
MQNAPYASVLIWVSAVCLLLAYLSWKRRVVDGAVAFAVMMVGAALYAFGSSFEVSSMSMVRTVWFMRLEFAGIVTMPAAWLVFALAYTRRQWKCPRRLLVLLLIVPALTMLAVWTNGSHHLFWRTMEIVTTTSGTMVLEKTYGLLFWVHLTYTYLLLVAGGVVLIRHVLRAGSFYRGQMAVLIAGGTVAILGNFIYLLRVSALRGLDLGPLGFMGLGLALVFDLLHFRIRDIIPIGRDALMDSTGDAVFLIDVDGEVVYLNPVASTLTGHSLAQADGQPAVLVLEELNSVHESLTSNETERVEIAVGSGSQARLFDLVVHPLCTKREVVVGRLVVLHETTAHKQEEDKLRLAQLQWDQFLEASPDEMWIKDASGRYVAANRTFRMVDPSVGGDIIGKTDAECFSPEKAAMYVADDRVAIDKGVSEGEFTAVGVDGRLRRFLTKKVVLRAPDGSVAGTLGVSRDITDRKNAEEEHRREQVLFDRLIDTAPEAIAISDTQGRVMRVNAEFVRMFGYEVDEVVGRSIDDLVVPPSHQEEAKALTATIRQREKTELETIRRRKDGTLIHVSLITAPIVIEGRQEGGYGIYRDITDRVRAEADKEAMQAQLRQSQKMEAIGELAGGVAHDFNNLLTGILGNIALMRSSLSPSDPLLENVNAAETSARQATDLTKGLLTFGRSAVVLPVPVRITDALDTTLAILKQSLPATMQIVRDDGQTVWNVLLDQSQLTQILLNLAVNARDAMQGKGILTIRTRNETVGEEYVQTQPFARTGEFVHMSVTDTGPGILPLVMQHLFEPFYTTKPIGSGTGLGLSIVYGAVKQAGGWITAISGEGADATVAPIERTSPGTTFDIYLPRCLEEPRQPVTVTPPSGDSCKGTVLVVEDEPVVARVAQAFLAKSGCTVLTAPDGASAMAILEERHADVGLVLLDMTMPGMTTDEIVHGIRALDATVAVLLTSGYTSSEEVRRMLEDGIVQGFLDKPYTMGELTDRVMGLIRT